MDPALEALTFTHVDPTSGNLTTWELSDVTFTALLTANLHFHDQVPFQTRYLELDATLHPAGLTLRAHWPATDDATPELAAAQAAVGDVRAVRRILGEQAALADRRHLSYEAELATASGTRAHHAQAASAQWRHWCDSLALLAAAYDLTGTEQRSVALGALAAGFAGTPEELAAAVHRAVEAPAL